MMTLSLKCHKYNLEVEVISVMTLVGDGMARPGGGEGPNHLWNHLNSQSPPTHRCHILEATLCPTKLVKQQQYIFHKRIQQQINNYKSPLKLAYSFTLFLSNLDDTNLVFKMQIKNRTHCIMG